MDLHIENISHSYEKLEVLKDINLFIKEKEIVCIVGPSGCGKSTLIDRFTPCSTMLSLI